MRKKLSTILLVISIILLSCLLLLNLYLLIRIGFFGLKVGSNEYPDSIWWGEVYLHGLSGIKHYYSTFGSILFWTEFPVAIISVVYQFIYFKFKKGDK